MRKTFVLFILVSASSALANPWIARIDIQDRAEIATLVDLDFQIYHDELESVVDLVVSDTDLQILQEMGYQPYDLVPFPEMDEIDLDPEYHTYIEFTDELQALAAVYPDLCKLDSIGAATQFQRAIWCMKLSDNPQIEEDELALLYIGTHHGNEPLGGETMLLMINTFLEQYGVDPEITGWMDNYEIFFVPFLNPDGHYAVTEGINDFWRKNARDIDGDNIYYEFIGGTWWTDDHEGIDLNRNYNWHWDEGGSSYMWDHDYRGEYPFSEGETSALKPLVVAQRPVCAISFHSYGEVVIYPWSMYGQPAPDQDVLEAKAIVLADAFIRDNGEAYDYDLYNGNNGQCRNWLYGFAGCIPFCLELNPYPIFLPPGNELAERTQRYMNGAVTLFDWMDGPGITGHIRDAITGQPLAARVEIQGRISDQVKPRFAEPQYGRYTRLLENGTYSVLAGMPGYYVERITGVNVNNTMTVLDIELTPLVTQAEFTEAKGAVPEFGLRITSHQSANIELEYVLPSATEVQIQVFNVLGKRVQRIDAGYRDAGNHTLNVDMATKPSGVYFVQIQTDQYSAVNKVMLLK
ncbi:T9SS type A sorting domain-containing protein [bacterium]|nr:T9SS type A sorting domain-containing protein [bacterium]MBU1881684.1 T9SS type A sorting domain-containing protein [bacterium]